MEILKNLKFKNNSHITLNSAFFHLFKILFLGILILLYLNYHSLENSFSKKIRNRTINDSNKINNQISDIFTYVEKITNVTAKNIAREGIGNRQKLAENLAILDAKIDYEKYNIFAITLFNFINLNDEIIATASEGILPNPVKVLPEKRAWVKDAKTKPWHLHFSKNDFGIISHEAIIPIGFGVTDANKKFIGTIAIGISINKIKLLLEGILNNSTSTFAILNRDNSVIITSDNFNHEALKELQTKALPHFDANNEIKNAAIIINDEEFFFSTIKDYPDVKIVIGTSKSDILTELLPQIYKLIFCALISITFFSALLFYFKRRFLNQIIEAIKFANKTTNSDLQNITIPHSEIVEVNAIFNLLRKLQNSHFSTDHLKELYEKEKRYQKEFLSSMTHEFQITTHGIVAAAEFVKSDLEFKKSHNKDFNAREIEEYQNLLKDIIRLSDEILLLSHDIVDVNHYTNGEFEIEKNSKSVNLQETISRVANLFRAYALRNKKLIVTHFVKSEDCNFLVGNLSEKLLKQALANLINVTIENCSDNSKIRISLEAIEKDVSEFLRDLLTKNVKNNEKFSDIHKSKLLKIIENSRPQVIIKIKANLAIANKAQNLLHKNQNGDYESRAILLAKELTEIQGGIFEISLRENGDLEVTMVF